MRLALYLVWPVLAAAADSAYVGSQVCGGCHRGIAAAQSNSRMAGTWQGLDARDLPPGYSASTREGEISYQVRRTANRITWTITTPDRPPLTAETEAVLGGPRQLSFLIRVRDIEGVTLDRAPLVETRYLYSKPRNSLELSPGFPTERPVSYQTSLGRVLSPQFENKCRTCHGAPATGFGGEAGVRCEHCHGPGADHVQSVKKGVSQVGIANPAKLNNAARIEQCGKCHADGRNLADPMPEDLLISDQADALVRTECYIQSGQGLSCSTCHDPHRDSPADAERYTNACLSCHSLREKQHASICPVNAKEKCVGCHMPAKPDGSVRRVDHWIRVLPSAAHTAKSDPGLRSRLKPKRIFLRTIMVDSRTKADEIHAELSRGGSFFDLAQRYSTDTSAVSGGFMGAMSVDELEANLANGASALRYGEISPVLSVNGKSTIVQRLPGDFRWQADRLYEEALQLKADGRIEAALEKNQEALQIYPRFLRALVFLGSTLGEQGEPARAVAVLQHAARLYPEDPGAQFNLGIAYGSAGRPSDEIQAYRRALAVEPDLISAYMNLAAALLAAGQTEQAAETYRQAIQVNPLSVVLYYSLALVYERQGNAAAAGRALAVASKIDPAFVKRQERSQ